MELRSVYIPLWRPDGGWSSSKSLDGRSLCEKESKSLSLIFYICDFFGLG